MFSNTLSVNIKQFSKYITSGILNIVSCWILLYILTTYVNMWYLFANAIIAIVYLILGLFMNIYLVFKPKMRSNRSRRTLLYVLIYTINCLLDTCLLFWLTDILGIYLLVSKIITSVFFTVWNFLILKRFVFK